MMKKSFFAIALGGLLFAACQTESDNPVQPTPDPEPEPEVASTAWTWDTSAPLGSVWCNMGYSGGNGAEVAISGSSKWWGVTSEDEFMQQLYHAEGEVAHGDESMDAYFLLFEDGKIERHAGDGSLINSGEYKFEPVTGNDWKVANLHTTAGTILWPYEINSSGNMPTVFEVIYKTDTKMVLVYPDEGKFDELGSWGEATYWYFKVQGSSDPFPAPAPTTSSIISSFNYCWHDGETVTANADGSLTYNAAEWGGLAAWLADDEGNLANLSEFTKLVFEFAVPTTFNTQILVEKGSDNVAQAWGEPGITKLECSFADANVSAVSQIGFQTSEATTINITKIYLVK